MEPDLKAAAGLSEKWKQPYIEARLQFLRAFYEYARTNTDGFATTWTTWTAAPPGA